MSKYAIGPDGRPYLLSEQQALETANTPGVTPITKENYGEQRKAAVASDHVDKNWGTGGKAAAGVASGLSLGLAPALATKLGMLNPDNLEAAEQSTAFTAGDVAGMVAPTLLTGGESLLARGAAQGGLRGASKIGLALSPAGLMGEAGGAAERLVGKFLGEAGILGRAANPTISMAARGAAEGAINNLAHTVSRDVIENKPLAADALLMSGVDGALFGGLVGGVLGGATHAAGAGIDLVGGRVAGMGAGRGGTESAGKVAKFLGGTDERLAQIEARQEGILGKLANPGREDGLVGNMRALEDIVNKGEGSIKNGVADVRAASQRAGKGYEAGIKDATRQMELEHPDLVPTRARVFGRMDIELSDGSGSIEGYVTGKLNRQLQKEMLGGERGALGKRPIEPTAPVAPTHASAPVAPVKRRAGEYVGAKGLQDAAKAEKAYAEASSKHTASVTKAESAHADALKKHHEAMASHGEAAAKWDKRAGALKSWDDWTRTRAALADKMDAAPAGSIQKGVYQKVLNIVDDEMVGESSALLAANKDLAKKYASNVIGKRIADEYVEMTANKAAAPAKSVLKMDNSDAATLGFSVFTGADPIMGMGILAGKKIVQHIGQKLEAPMAEAAFRNAIGAQASHATINIGNRISQGVKGFLNGTRVAAEGKHAESNAKPSYTMDSYKKSMELADELTSAAHQAKVRENMQALSDQGHPELAKAMAETYGRAVAYVQKNKPKGGINGGQPGKLGKLPKAMGLGTQEMKFIRQLHSMTNPIGAVIGGIERGDLSRDAVAVFQNVFPAQAADLNMRVAQEIVAYRDEGKFVPADKVTMLGTLLNSVVDSKLSPDFISEVQQGLAANKAPAKDSPQGPPPNTDVSSYQTPLQTSIG